MIEDYTTPEERLRRSQPDQDETLGEALLAFTVTFIACVALIFVYGAIR